MKRKLLAGICIFALTFAVCGCGKEKPQTEPQITESSVTAESKQGETVEPVNVPQNTEQAVTEESEVWLYSSMYRSLTRLENGKAVELIPLDAISEGGTFLELYGRNAIFYTFEADYERSLFGNYYYVVNIDTEERQDIGFVEGGSINANVVDDTLVVVIYKDYIYTERVFDLKTYEELPADLTNYTKQKNYMLVSYDYLDYSHETGANQIAERNGFVLWKNGDNLVKIEGNSETNLGNLFENAIIQGYRGSKVVSAKYSDNYTTRSLYVTDLDSRKEVTVCKNVNGILNIDEKYVYYRTLDTSLLMSSTYSIHRYDLYTGEDCTLVTCSMHPGMDNYIPGSDVTVVGEDVYYLYDDGVETGWFVYDGRTGNTRNLNATLKTYPYFELGNIEVEYRSRTCDFCGATFAEYYGEYFVFDESAIPAAAVVNKKLQEHSKGYADTFEENVDYVLGETDCETHSTYYGTYTETDEITEVFKLGTKYVAINTEGYVYTGGAHGMPGKGSALYNTETGEEVSFYDLYSGTFEEFRILAAEKTRENFLSYENAEASPYFADDPDVVYEESYESIYEEYLPIIWGQEDLILSYQPYVMGSYAAGFIEILISYEELGIDFN